MCQSDTHINITLLDISNQTVVQQQHRDDRRWTIASICIYTRRAKMSMHAHSSIISKTYWHRLVQSPNAINLLVCERIIAPRCISDDKKKALRNQTAYAHTQMHCERIDMFRTWAKIHTSTVNCVKINEMAKRCIRNLSTWHARTKSAWVSDIQRWMANMRTTLNKKIESNNRPSCALDLARLRDE